MFLERNEVKMHYRKIKGPHVYLAPLRLEDAETYMKWLNDPEVAIGICKHHQVVSEQVAEADLRYFTDAKDRHSFAIVFDRGEKLIGYCGLFDLDFVRSSATIGIALGEGEYMNKGYGTEAMALLLHYGFNHLNLHNIQLAYVSYNTRGEKAYHKLGFREIGRRREAIRMNGKYYDEILMDLLEDEFRNSPWQTIVNQSLLGYEMDRK